MPAMRDWRTFVRQRLRLPDLAPEREARIVRELAAQLEDFYRDAIAAGASDADADAYAQRQIDDWDEMAHAVRVADRAHARPALERGLERMTDAHAASLPRRPRTRGALLMFAHMIRDARYAVRQLIRTPGFTVVAVLTVALAIGASSTMFSVVNGVLLRPLPVPQPDGLVRVHEVLQKFGRFSVAPVKFKNVGGLVTPLVIEWTYKDGSKEIERIPAEIWRINETEVTKVFVKEKEVANIVLDPNFELADIDVNNNIFPKKPGESKFDQFKKNN
jgi:hypothetical protein